MKVTLLSHTPDALNLLLKTKNTRLSFNSDPATWPNEKKEEHLEYMRDTIKSSWEFVDYVFHIEEVTRAFTHQLVRTRTGSYAQESQRTVDVSDHKALMPERLANSGDDALRGVWDDGVDAAMEAYKDMISVGVAPQDARGILPTNILTSIICKFNLRTLHDTAKLRLCTRTQGEYQQVFRAMREAVFAVHPWVKQFGFLEVHCVSTGTCAFPRYGKSECPIYFEAMDNTWVRAQAKLLFDASRYEARPVAREGKAS